MYWYFIHIVFILCPSNYVIIAREVVVHTENFSARLRSRTIIQKVCRKKVYFSKLTTQKMPFGLINRPTIFIRSPELISAHSKTSSAHKLALQLSILPIPAVQNRIKIPRDPFRSELSPSEALIEEIKI